MLGVNARPAVAKVVAPIVPALVRAGVTPDMITITGTVGAVVSAVFLIGSGNLFWGAAAVTVFVPTFHDGIASPSWITVPLKSDGSSAQMRDASTSSPVCVIQ